MKTANKIFIWLSVFVLCCFCPPLVLVVISLKANKIAANYLESKKEKE